MEASADGGTIAEFAGKTLVQGEPDASSFPSGGSAPQDATFHFEPGKSYRDTRAKYDAEFETKYVKWLLARHQGNVSAAAREARMDRKHLHDMAKKHGLRGAEPGDGGGLDARGVDHVLGPVARQDQVAPGRRGARAPGILGRRSGKRGAPLAHELPRRQGGRNVRYALHILPDHLCDLVARKF